MSWVKPLKKFRDLVLVLGFKADTVVLKSQAPVLLEVSVGMVRIVPAHFLTIYGNERLSVGNFNTLLNRLVKLAHLEITCPNNRKFFTYKPCILSLIINSKSDLHKSTTVFNSTSVNSSSCFERRLNANMDWTIPSFSLQHYQFVLDSLLQYAGREICY